MASLVGSRRKFCWFKGMCLSTSCFMKASPPPILSDQQGLVALHFLYAEVIMHTLNIDPWFVNKAKQTRDGRLNAYDTLDARKTALVVVDMQNYFVADGMPACAPEAR